MSPGLTTERVYDALKRQIMRGERAAGERLDPARLAEELGASATPVRDALHRLLGERLVQARAQEGFRVPVLSEMALRDLYAWSRDLLALALRSAKRLAPHLPEPGAQSDEDEAARAAALFDAVAAASGNGEHRLALVQTSERLHAARRIEPLVIAGSADELMAMEAAWSGGVASDLRRLVSTYHRRRLNAVASIVALLGERGNQGA